jgi:probable sporulation protein (polysaccharide deacetylase family)
MKRTLIVSFRIRVRPLLSVCLVGALLLTGLLWRGEVSQGVPVITAMAGDSEAALHQRLELLAKEYDAPPIDAKNDRVWKAIPGLNGVRLNIEKSLEKGMGMSVGERLPLVFEQIPPKISLDDLGPLPIYRGNPQKKQMALMINVAWGTEYIADMLDILEKNGVKATFFLDGSWTAQNGEVARQIHARGHEIGNHAYSHPDMAKMGESSQRREITRTNEAIQQAIGVRPALFAPPSGSYNETTVRLAHGERMRTILWTIDTIDWKKPPAETIRSRVVTKAESGGLVLMHPTEPTVAALRAIVPELLKKGFDLVTVSELISPIRPVPSS